MQNETTILLDSINAYENNFLSKKELERKLRTYFHNYYSDIPSLELLKRNLEETKTEPVIKTETLNSIVGLEDVIFAYRNWLGHEQLPSNFFEDFHNLIKMLYPTTYDEAIKLDNICETLLEIAKKVNWLKYKKYKTDYDCYVSQLYYSLLQENIVLAYDFFQTFRMYNQNCQHIYDDWNLFEIIKLSEKYSSKVLERTRNYGIK